jgi:hypothetical protein
LTTDPLDGLSLGPGHPHGSNLGTKLKGGSAASEAAEVARLYRNWRTRAEKVPFSGSSVDDFAKAQTRIFNRYRNALDQPEFDRAFDSRGALVSSALEEFCRYLLAPVVEEALGADEHDIQLGHFDVYQGLFFTAESFADFAALPTAHYPRVNMDFVIAKRVDAETRSGEQVDGPTPIYLPAVAIECKTYLDRTRYHAADGNATTVKGGVPGCMYLVVAEMLKLKLAGVNLHGSRIDHIFVLRKARNVDLKKRRQDGTKLKPIQWDAVSALISAVRSHLQEDWSQPENWLSSGRLK